MARTSRPPSEARPSDARGVATATLLRVFSEQAFASRALDAELAAAQLAERDARLATEIVYGTLRTLPKLDAVLGRYLTRGWPEPFTLAALRAATYQALCLGRVPAFAIVQETVNLVKARRGERLAKLTNAVLRRVVAERPASPAPSSVMEVPPWIRAELVAGLGEARAERALTLDERPPPVGLRVSPSEQPDAVRAAIMDQAPRAEVRASDVAPHALCAWGLGDVRKLGVYAEGRIASQDEGAQLVGLALEAQPGDAVLDACAGRGGKTAQLASAVGPRGHVTAADIHAAKLAQIVPELSRLGLSDRSVATECIDFSVGHGGLARRYDRILVDAPCTGLGTLRRRPEIAMRLLETDPTRMASLQLAILRNVLPLLRPMGTLVFAVCSGTRAESLGVAAQLEAREPAIERLHGPIGGLDCAVDDDGVLRIGPWLSPLGGAPDVYQVIRWRKLDRPPLAV